MKNYSKGSIIIPLIALLGAMNSQRLYARDVVDTANRLSKIVTQTGMALTLGGLALCGIYFLAGKQDASTKLTQCFIGMLCLWGGTTLINLVSSVA